jgi:hypothetical protein
MIKYLFRQFETAELEQMRCVYDFLFWCMKDDFRAKCQHDV